MRQLFFAGALCLTSVSFGYTNTFTLNFNTAGAAGWSDPVQGGTTFVTGETTPADSPAYSPMPSAGTGFNNSGWLRVGATTQANGIALGVYDGTAGGNTTTDPTDYSVEGDVFVVVSGTYRMQSGLIARWTSTAANFPFEFFHGARIGANPTGYGVRGGGQATGGVYNIFGSTVGETANRWVHMKIAVTGGQAIVSVDRNQDGTYDNVSSPITLNSTAGKAGVFSVINDPANAGALVANQFSYFDNFKYTPTAAVQDWTLY